MMSKITKHVIPMGTHAFSLYFDEYDVVISFFKG